MPWQDPAPRRISLLEWDDLFGEVPDELIQQYRYYRTSAPDAPATNDQRPAANGHPWSTYLYPPTTFSIYGSRHLRRLKFDNSLAALRMWGFVMSETERLFRARQIGRKVIATMGDLGGTPPLVLAAGNAVPFYPDCIWWVPFTNESTVLFNAAAGLGIGDSACYSRATLGAFQKRSYFPDPVLCIASTGASCDDYSAVEQLVESMGFPVHWFELPLRKERADQVRAACDRCEVWNSTPAGIDYQESAREFLTAQFQSLRRKLASVLGAEPDAAALQASIAKVNAIRRQVRHTKEMVYSAPAPVFPALEMMVLEFGNLHFYSDIEEWSSVLADVEETVQERLRLGRYLADSAGRSDELRVIWVTPPADPLLLNYAEDQGLRIVGTEYVINQSLHEIQPPRVDRRSPGIDDWLDALAEALLNASLIGSSRARAESAIRQAREFRADGVVISGILGGSHCATETSLIRDCVQEQLDLPVLAFDVPAPTTGISSQIRTRMEAFIEVLKARRQ